MYTTYSSPVLIELNNDRYRIEGMVYLSCFYRQRGDTQNIPPCALASAKQVIWIGLMITI